MASVVYLFDTITTTWGLVSLFSATPTADLFRVPLSLIAAVSHTLLSPFAFLSK